MNTRPARDAAARRLVILDDIFPHQLSAFRIAEYNAYLEWRPDAVVYSTGAAFRYIGETRPFRAVLEDYAKLYPRLAPRVREYTPDIDLRGALVYTMFLKNAWAFLDAIEAAGAELVFTLYPGGGFGLCDEASDRRLRRLCASPSLRRVIVTMNASREYLLARELCAPERMRFVYGTVFLSQRLAGDRVPRQHYKQEKGTFDICFVAQKYTATGIDKGYDVFLQVATRLRGRLGDVRFHVVGPWSASDPAVDAIRPATTFHGPLHTDAFPEFYSRMDLILSPNVPFALEPGGFDGFPTGCCIEAALCGVAVFCTDHLGQNLEFEDREEIVLISRDVTEICALVEHYYRDYDALVRLARRGTQAFRRVFDIEQQMQPRRELLAEILDADAGPRSPRSVTPPEAPIDGGEGDDDGSTVREQSLRRLERDERQAVELGEYLRRTGRGLGGDVQLKRHVSHEWWWRVHRATEDLAAVIPSGTRFILADEGSWGDAPVFDDRRNVPYTERDGRYWGAPPDDATAIAELERLREAGAEFAAFAWPAFWQLDYYARLGEHLRTRYRRVLANDRVVVFDLREREGGPP